VKEEDIRKYVRIEILREDAIERDSFLGTLISAFDDVLKAAKLAFKDILNSTRFLIAVTFATDPETIKQLRESYRNKKEGIISDYQNFFGSLTESMGTDFQFLAYIVAPGPYLAAKVVLEGPGWASDVKAFLNEAGFDFEYPTRRGTDDGSEESKRQNQVTNMLQDQLRGAPMQIRAFRDAQRKFIEDLDRRLGLTGTSESNASRTGLPVIVEEKSSGIASISNEEFKQASKFLTDSLAGFIEKIPAEKLVKPADMKKLIDLKRKTADEYASQLNAPLAFAAKAAKAKDLNELRELIKSQKTGAIRINGLGSETEKNVTDLTKKMIDKAKKEGKQADLLKSAGMQPSNTSDEALTQAAGIVVTKKVIEDFVMTIKDPKSAGEDGKGFIESVESLRKQLIEQYTSDVTSEVRSILTKSKAGKEFLSVHDEGLRKINAAGLPGMKMGE
jgi:hypothetical protein